MSSIGFGDLSLLSDALSGNGFKPWWETIRGYIVVTMYASTFFIIYGVQPEAVIHCRPPTNLSNTLSAADTVYVNSVCFDQLDMWLVNVGSISLAECVIIHLWYSWWLMIPRVSKTFSKIRRADVKLEGVKLAAESLKLKARQLCFYPDVPAAEDLGISHEDASTITGVCADLWNPRSESLLTIRQIYVIRNAVAIIPLGLSIYSCGRLINASESSFTCKVNITTYSEMECNHNLSKRIIPFLITITTCEVVLVILSLAMIIALYLLRNRPDVHISMVNNIEGWSQFRAKEYDNIFVKVLSKHATSLSRKTEGILCVTDVCPLEEFKTRLDSHFASSVRTFLWDLDGKVFLKGLDEYRKVRTLSVQVLAQKRFKEFVEEHYKLINAPGALNNSISNIDPCGCRYLFAEFKEKNLKDETQDKKSLFQYVLEVADITETQTLELLTHFLENLPPKLIKYGAREAKGCLGKNNDGIIPEQFTKLLERFGVSNENPPQTSNRNPASGLQLQIAVADTDA